MDARALADPIVIIDYDAGNLRSVQRACAEVGADAVISNDPARVRVASRIIFPGVGAAGSAMASLRRGGLAAALRSAVGDGKPVLGICLGLQISLRHSEENDTETLGLIPGVTRRFRLDRPDLKIPHMGWNEVRPVKPHPLLDGIEAGDEFYFVHALLSRPGGSSLRLCPHHLRGRLRRRRGPRQLLRRSISPREKRPGGPSDARSLHPLGRSMLTRMFHQGLR